MIVDQLGRNIDLKSTPKRIVSLVPSITELVCDLGLASALVGVTKFCVHPSEIKKESTQIGGTKNPHIDKIRGLKPDLILANKEENLKEHIDLLAEEFPVFVSDIADVSDSIALIKTLGEVLRAENSADKLCSRIADILAGIKKYSTGFAPKTALYLIWKDPFMAAGTDTYISHMLSLFGIQNILEGQGVNGIRYPEVNAEEIIKLNPDVIFLSSEPYPFKAQHVMDLSREFQIKNKLVDGELFSWYGSRLIHCFPSVSNIESDIKQIFH